MTYLLSELIQDAVKLLAEKGDMPVVGDLLTENQSNLFRIAPGLDVFDDNCYITFDVNHLTPVQVRKHIK